MCRIVRNLALMRFRFEHAKRRDPDNLIPLSDVEASTADNAVSVSDEETGRLIDSFLRKQSADTRNVFIRKYWFCDSIEDIARDYSFSISKVKSMLFHTRNKLKKFLKEEGIDI